MTKIRASITNLETQLQKLATSMYNKPQVNSPRTTEVNPKEQCKAITLRSGTMYEEPTVNNSEKMTNEAVNQEEKKRAIDSKGATKQY